MRNWRDGYEMSRSGGFGQFQHDPGQQTQWPDGIVELLPQRLHVFQKSLY